MKPSKFDFEQLKKKHLENHIQDSQNETFKLIAGDASDRKFYRFWDGKDKAICMWFPKWEGGYGGDPISWLKMHEAFAHVGLPVPAVLKIDPQNSCIWTEDFGDVFLNHGMKSGEKLDHLNPSQSNVIQRYQQAILLLARAQFPKVDYPENPAMHRFFDFEKLNFEMDFFFSNFCQKWLKLDMNDKLILDVKKELVSVCETLAQKRRVICHRDYHVRNIMIVDNETKWIDFQDARVGPLSYDLVSLVRDSYVKVDHDTRQFFYNFYFDSVRKAKGFNSSKEELFDEIEMMGIQRNIKALGSFGYLAVEKGKSDYLKYIFNTFETLVGEMDKSSTAVKKNHANTYHFLSELLNGGLKDRVVQKCAEFGVKNFF